MRITYQLIFLLLLSGSLISPALAQQRNQPSQPTATYGNPQATYAYPATNDPRVLRQQQKAYQQWQKDQKRAQQAAEQQAKAQHRQQQAWKRQQRQSEQQQRKLQTQSKQQAKAQHHQQRKVTKQQQQLQRAGKQQQAAAKQQKKQWKKQQSRLQKSSQKQASAAKSQQKQARKQAKTAPSSGLPVYTSSPAPTSNPALRPSGRRLRYQSSHIQQMLRISPRFQYGVGGFWSKMTYQQPDLTAPIDQALGGLQNSYPWVPWNQLSVQEGEAPMRERKQYSGGKFFGTIGLNLPVIFMEIEAGSGRFQQPNVTLGDFWPLQQGFSLGKLSNLMMGRMGKSSSLGAATLRIGLDLERVLPERHQLVWKRDGLKLGLDASIYYFAGVDMSYRPGSELFGNDLEDRLGNLLDPIPLISDTKKAEAAASILSQLDEKMPAYFWVPALRGFGGVAKGYLDIGRRIRLSLEYHHERARGIQVPNSEWLQPGPLVKRSFLTFGITTQL